MNHPVLVPSNDGNGSQRNHNQTCTTQPPVSTKQGESTPITKEFDHSSCNNTVEAVKSNDIF